MMTKGRVGLCAVVLLAACSGDTPVSQEVVDELTDLDAPIAEAQVLPLDAAPTKGVLAGVQEQVADLPVGSCVANFGAAPGEFYVLRFRLGAGAGDVASAEVRTKAFRTVEGRLLVRISCRYVPSDRADRIVDKVLDWAPGRGGAMQALRGRVKRQDPVGLRGRGPQGVDGVVATVCQNGEGWVYWPYLDDCVCDAGPDQCEDPGGDETDDPDDGWGDDDDDDDGPGGGPLPDGDDAEHRLPAGDLARVDQLRIPATARGGW